MWMQEKPHLQNKYCIIQKVLEVEGEWIIKLFLDNHKIEKERGITVFSEQGTFQYRDSTCYLIDTPGHMDFHLKWKELFRLWTML